VYSNDKSKQNMENMAIEMEKLGEMSRKNIYCVEAECYLLGYSAPEQELIKLFNKVDPVINIETAVMQKYPNAFSFNIKSYVKEYSIIEGEKIFYKIEDAQSLAISSIIHYLVSLSIATGGFCYWQKISINQNILKCFNYVTNKNELYRINYQIKTFNNQVQLDYKHIYASIDIFEYLFVNKFLVQFYKTYQKGELLYSFYEDENVSLLEESYLCFFKCLEYTVMKKILNKNGTMDYKDIRDVFKRLHIENLDAEDKDRDLIETGRYLIRQRGEYSAHFNKTEIKKEEYIKNITELKNFIDFIIKVYTVIRYQY